MSSLSMVRFVKLHFYRCCHPCFPYSRGKDKEKVLNKSNEGNCKDTI